MWIPCQPEDLDVETVARAIVVAARDATVPPPGQRRVVEVFFKNSKYAGRVVDCINEHYEGAYHWMIDVKLSH